MNGVTPSVSSSAIDVDIPDTTSVTTMKIKEGLAIPLLMTGLWQMSRHAWGSASAARIDEALTKLVKNGFLGADMPDHCVSVACQACNSWWTISCRTTAHRGQDGWITLLTSIGGR